LKLDKGLATLSSCIIDFILPRTCIVCKQEIDRGAVCNGCLDTITHVRDPACPVCGRPIQKQKKCAYCRHEKDLDYGRAWALYMPPMDTVMHFFKYRRFRGLSSFLGLSMANIVRHDLRLKEADRVVPVPLYWWKRLKRGYNQSRLLASVISRECGIPLHDALARTRNTRTQTRLTGEKRQRNVRGAFRLNGDGIEDKTILLVDDVMTTGATIRECARALKRSGAARVYSIVAGITTG
jgi:competence protein ComFC